MRAARWSDGDRYFGPFTYGISDYRPLAVVLTSAGDGEDNRRGCELRINLWALYLIIAMPNIIRPHRTKVYPGWDAATIARLGRDWYWDVDPRSYGFSSNDGHFSIYRGRHGGSSQDSSVEQRWSCFLPWTQWRHVRISFYDLNLQHIGSVFDKEQPRGMRHFDAQRAMEDRVPKQRFRFRDFDGEELIATAHVEEREWRRGTGWFKWMSMVWPKKIRRCLSLEFSGETGKRKGSWKGGTTGHSIEMRRDDTHFQAFLRYCKDHDMEFITWESGDGSKIG